MNKLASPLQAALWWLLPLVALAALVGWETEWGRAVETRPQPAEAIEPKPVAASLLPEFEIAGGVATRTRHRRPHAFQPDAPSRAACHGGEYRRAVEARAVRVDGNDAGRRQEHRVPARARREQGAPRARRRIDQRHAGRRGQGRSREVHARRRIRGARPQGGDQSAPDACAASRPRRPPPPSPPRFRWLPRLRRRPRPPQPQRTPARATTHRRPSSAAAPRVPLRPPRQPKARRTLRRWPAPRRPQQAAHLGTRSTRTIATVRQAAIAFPTPPSDPDRRIPRRTDPASPGNEKMTKRHLAFPCAALVAAVFVTACATSPDVGQPPSLKSLPNRGTSNVSPALADAAERAQVPGAAARRGQVAPVQGHGRARQGPAARRRTSVRARSWCSRAAAASSSISRAPTCARSSGTSSATS